MPQRDDYTFVPDPAATLPFKRPATVPSEPPSEGSIDAPRPGPARPVARAALHVPSLVLGFVAGVALTAMLTGAVLLFALVLG